MAWSLAAAVLILLAIVFRYTQPLLDSDLWFHLVSGRYFIENKTLVADHALFTWTPVQTDSIYCTWLADVFLYGLYQISGLTGLYALRYLCILFFILSVLLFAKHLGLSRHPLTWLITLIGTLVAHSASAIKPSMASFVLMTLLVGLWWTIRSRGNKAWRLCYGFPIIMIIWVNTHGIFIFGAFFLLMLGLGEAFNMVFSPRASHPGKVRQQPRQEADAAGWLAELLADKLRLHLFISIIISALAVFLNPYGWKYIAYFAKKIFFPFLVGGDDFGLGHIHGAGYIQEYQPTFEIPGGHYLKYMILLLLIFLPLFWQTVKRRRIDYTILSTNLSFCLFFIWMVRLTYLWAPVICFSTIFLMYQYPHWINPTRRALRGSMGVIIAVLSIYLVAEASNDAVCHRIHRGWMGFGVSYLNPVEEEEYIRRNLPGLRIGNDYISGAYLYWALGPQRKVMIDARRFPFNEWYKDYWDFTHGRGVEKFLEKFPSDLFCLRYVHQPLIEWFLASPSWKLAFYGSFGIIFIRDYVELPEGKILFGNGTLNFNNFKQATECFNFVVGIREFDIAADILSSIQKRFKCPNQKKPIKGLTTFLNGMKAFYRRDYQFAAMQFEICRKTGIINVNLHLSTCYHLLAREAWKTGDQEKAVNYENLALEINPNDPYALFNLGVINLKLGRQLERRPQKHPKGPAVSGEWRQYFKKFLLVKRQASSSVDNSVVFVQRLLKSDGQDPPGYYPMLYPRDPAAGPVRERPVVFKK